ncbi:MAG TPA: succinate dehydrogenase cytochrome b subunit [Bacteroidota bacterium]|nr:succinate dehydrogenase cytochrome b subunit [Bacteroidota bacterium]
MGLLTDFYSSSIGKKITVGLTGALLCAYLIVHLAGNLLLFRNDGGEAFDAYAEILPGLLIINIIEVGLFGVFIVHIVTGLIFWLRNRRARPAPYAVNRRNENSDPFSRTMFLTGSVVFIFLVIHLKTFWVPARFPAEGQHPSMYEAVVRAFADPVYSLFYVVAMALLAFHLRHGFQSALQTFGLRNMKYAGLIDFAGTLFWLLIPVGFATIPIFFFLKA